MKIEKNTLRFAYCAMVLPVSLIYWDNLIVHVLINLSYILYCLFSFKKASHLKLVFIVTYYCFIFWLFSSLTYGLSSIDLNRHEYFYFLKIFIKFFSVLSTIELYFNSFLFRNPNYYYLVDNEDFGVFDFEMLLKRRLPLNSRIRNKNDEKWILFKESPEYIKKNKRAKLVEIFYVTSGILLFISLYGIVFQSIKVVYQSIEKSQNIFDIYKNNLDHQFIFTNCVPLFLWCILVWSILKNKVNE